MSWMKTYAQGSLLVSTLIAANALLHLYSAKVGMLGAVTASFEVLWLIVSALACLGNTRFGFTMLVPLLYVVYDLFSLVAPVAMMLSLGRDNAMRWLVHLREHPAPVYYVALGFTAIWAAMNVVLLLKKTPDTQLQPAKPEAEAN